MSLGELQKFNNTELPEDFILAPTSQNIQENESSSSKVGLNITASTFVQALIWSSMMVSCYGLLYVVHKLPGNLYLNSFLLSIFELPTGFIAITFCNRYGRKKTNLLPLLTSGICCVFIAVAPSGSIAKVIFAVAAKFLVIITFVAIYLWSAELYETRVRSTALGILEFVSRISTGGVMFLAASTAPSWVIFTVLGSSSIVAAAFGVLLPETNPNTVIQKIGSDSRGDRKSEFDQLQTAYNYLVHFRFRQKRQSPT